MDVYLRPLLLLDVHMLDVLGIGPARLVVMAQRSDHEPATDACSLDTHCALHVQVLITCSLVMLTCLVWFAWVIHTFLTSRRVRRERGHQRLELALAGLPVPVGVPEDIIARAAPPQHL